MYMYVILRTETQCTHVCLIRATDNVYVDYVYTYTQCISMYIHCVDRVEFKLSLARNSATRNESRNWNLG